MRPIKPAGKRRPARPQPGRSASPGRCVDGDVARPAPPERSEGRGSAATGALGRAASRSGRPPRCRGGERHRAQRGAGREAAVGASPSRRAPPPRRRGRCVDGNAARPAPPERSEGRGSAATGALGRAASRSPGTLRGNPGCNALAMLGALEVEDGDSCRSSDPKRLAGSSSCATVAGQRAVGRVAEDEADGIV